jgi:imidazolonepropionase-like amidohydrolase
MRTTGSSMDPRRRGDDHQAARRPRGGGDPGTNRLSLLAMTKTALLTRAVALATAATLAAPALAAGQAARPAGSPSTTTLIKNATVLTVTKGTLQNTDVLLQNGKIARIGQNLAAPAGATVVDATGKFVMPGIIDPHSHMMSDAINEGSLSVTSMVRITDVLNPTAVNVYRALAGGVTTINILHGSANTIGGQNATVKLKHGRPVEEMVFAGAPPGIKFALGENVTRKNRQGAAAPGAPQPRYPSTRMGQEEVLRDAFTRARDYKAGWDDYRARTARGERGLVAPRRDLELEPLVEVLEGKRLVHAHSYRADEMLMLLHLADEFGFKVKTLQHGLEGYKIATEIAKHGAGLSTFADSWSYKIEAYDAIPYNVAILLRHGVVATINSDSDERVRRLNIDAAKLMRYGGLTEEEALKTITYNGAVQLGVEGKVGSIEVGKDADVAIWSAHPLSVYANVDKTFIDGEVYFDRQKDLAQRAALAGERAELERAEANQLPSQQQRPTRPAIIPHEENR